MRLKVIVCFILCSMLAYADVGEDEFSNTAEESGEKVSRIQKLRVLKNAKILATAKKPIRVNLYLRQKLKSGLDCLEDLTSFPIMSAGVKPKRLADQRLKVG